MITSGLEFVLVLLGSLGLSVFAGGLMRLLAPGWAAEQWLASAGVGFGILPVVVVGVWTYSYGKAQAANVKVKEAEAAERNARANALQHPPQQAQQPEMVQPDIDVARVAHWNVAVHRFIQAGARTGFGVRNLAGDHSPNKVCSWEAWSELIKPLVDGGVLVTSKRGTFFAADWDYERWKAERRGLRLPFPSHEPPEVAVTINTTTQQHPTPAATGTD